MIYDIRQTTTYAYASTAMFARHVLRMSPTSRDGVRVLAASLDIDPPPVERRDGEDFFGNRAAWIELDRPHDRLVVRMSARVAVAARPEPLPGLTPPWEQVAAAAIAAADLGPEAPAHFLFASRQVSLDPEIRAYAVESFPAGRPVVDGAVDLMRRIGADFVYEVGATDVLTTPPMSFALRRGVCQDFAHIMISGLRGLGLPAAYVSGYLRTVPPEGGVRLEGVDAMHAWVALWCGPELGWYGLDPTNDVLAGDDHVPLAIGRDYADVAPVDGVVFAAGGQKLSVAVTVTPVVPRRQGAAAET